MFTTQATLQLGSAVAVDTARACIWFGQADGTLGSVGFSQGSDVKIHQKIDKEINGLAVNDNVLLVTSKDGLVFTLDPSNPSNPPLAEFHVSPGAGHAGLTSKTGVVTHDETTATPGLTLITLDDGSQRKVLVPGLSGVAVAEDHTFVACNDTNTGRGTVGILRGSAVGQVASGLPTVGRLGLNESRVIAALPRISCLAEIDFSGGTTKIVGPLHLPGTIIEATGLPDGRLAILTTEAISMADSLNSLSGEPFIEPPKPIFIGSWTRLNIGLGDTSLTPADVTFTVPEGYGAGFVSYAREDTGKDPIPFLVAGGAVGKHRVNMVKRGTDTVLATTTFIITNLWTRVDVGPPGFIGAAFPLADGKSPYGDGSPDTPQNIGIHVHSGNWRALVLMIDTQTARWPVGADLNARRQSIMEHVSTGFDVGGGTRKSARQYYEENSAFRAAAPPTPVRGLTLPVVGNIIRGPVSMDVAWTDLFHQTVDPDTGLVTDTRWVSTSAAVQSIITTAVATGAATTNDFSATDVLIIVPMSPDSPAGDRFVWPHCLALGKQSFLCGPNARTDNRDLAPIMVPLDFFEHDGRHLHSTLSHELGHTLDLPDMYAFPSYSIDVRDRITGGREIMAGSTNTLPHYSIATKMHMGWIQPTHVKLFDIRGTGGFNQDVTLRASELDDPAPGGLEFKAIEFRLGDGWNYYVEYRAPQAGQISDQTQASANGTARRPTGKARTLKCATIGRVRTRAASPTSHGWATRTRWWPRSRMAGTWRRGAWWPTSS
jgi:M6 family metalloprotease-like protein